MPRPARGGAQRVAEAGFEAPAVAVFGEVVSLRDELNWFEGRPLSGKRIVVTRTRTQAGVLSAQLRGLGADVIVGHPGESDTDFEATMTLVRELPLTYLHAPTGRGDDYVDLTGEPEFVDPRAGRVARAQPDRRMHADDDGDRRP